MILAIDPGGTTGLVLLSPQGRVVESRSIKRFENILDFIKESSPKIVVIEDFIGGGPRTKEAIFVLRLIGKIEGVCEMLAISVVLQTPQTRKPFLSKAEGTNTKHEKDALAHGLAYLYRSTK